MILINCAACAAPLAHDAPRCERCQVRYCDMPCRLDHWRRGHKQICKKIHRGGGAEQYHADKKYKEAVAFAVEACAEYIPEDATCYICLEDTGEGLVCGCECAYSGATDTSFVHLSCLVRRARMVVEDDYDYNSDADPVLSLNSRWTRWRSCGVCKCVFDNDLYPALGWACWKTYLSRPEDDQLRIFAITGLGICLGHLDRVEEAFPVLEAALGCFQRNLARPEAILWCRAQIAKCHYRLGRKEEALQRSIDIFVDTLDLYGEGNERTIVAVNNLTSVLCGLRRYDEAMRFLLRSGGCGPEVSQRHALKFRARFLRVDSFGEERTAWQVYSNLMGADGLDSLETKVENLFGAEAEITGAVRYEAEVTGALAYANVWTGFACIFGAVPALISLYCSGAARACCYALVVAVFAVWWFIAVDCVNYLLGGKSYTCRGGPLRRPPLCADDKQVPKVRSDSYLVVAFFLMVFAYRQPDFYNSYLARTLGAFSTISCVQAYRYA